MLPVCPRCAERAHAHEILGKFPPARVKCRSCGTPLKLVWRPLALLALWLGVMLLAWVVWQTLARPDLRVIVVIAAAMAAVGASFLGLGLVERDVAADGTSVPSDKSGDGRAQA